MKFIKSLYVNPCINNPIENPIIISGMLKNKLNTNQ